MIVRFNISIQFLGESQQLRSPIERSYKCKVLAHFPENVAWNLFDKHAACMVSIFCIFNLNNVILLNVKIYLWNWMALQIWYYLKI